MVDTLRFHYDDEQCKVRWVSSNATRNDKKSDIKHSIKIIYKFGFIICITVKRFWGPYQLMFVGRRT